MKSGNEGPGKRTDANKNDPTAPFPNAEKPSAAIVNRRESDKIRNHMEGDEDINGPNFNEDSKNEDGDTGVNAGVYK